MHFIKESLLTAADVCSINAEVLEDEKTVEIKEYVYKKFTNGKKGTPVWEILTNDVSNYDPNGWSALSDFPYKGKVYVFFDDEDLTFIFDNIKELVLALAECIGFVFYVTDVNCSFLLCHNDHDYLIGAGDIRGWEYFKT